MTVFALTLLGPASNGTCDTLSQPTAASAGSKAPRGTEDFDSRIEDLKKCLAGSVDGQAAARVKYTIAVLEFKAGKMEEAQNGFARLAQEPNCPPPLKILALNMLAQTTRLAGKDIEALDAFAEMIRLIAVQPPASAEGNGQASLPCLQCLGMFARAEIYEKRQDNVSGTAEYEKLVQFLSRKTKAELVAKYLPLAYDRLSQLYLKQSHTNKYHQAVASLLAGFPYYERNTLIRLESLFIRAAQENHWDVNDALGSTAVPAQVIDQIRMAPNKTAARALAVNVEKLCRELPKADPWSSLLRYDCAWLFDALGEPKKAAEYFAMVYAQPPDNATAQVPSLAALADFSGYARIQAAIILAEQDQYKQAAAVLTGQPPRAQPNNLSDLITSVKESIGILEKEHITHVQAK